LFQTQDRSDLVSHGALPPPEVGFGAIQLLQPRFDFLIPRGPLSQKHGKFISQQALPPLEFAACSLQLSQFGKELGCLIFTEIERFRHLPDLDRLNHTSSLSGPWRTGTWRRERLPLGRRHDEKNRRHSNSGQQGTATSR